MLELADSADPNRYPLVGRDHARAMLDELYDRFASGDLQPLPFKAWPIDDSVKAFRHMAQGKHLGKVVISLADFQTLDALPIRKDVTYLITGGLGGLGLTLADRLARDCEARLVLLRQPPGPLRDPRSGRHHGYRSGPGPPPERVR